MNEQTQDTDQLLDELWRNAQKDIDAIDPADASTNWKIQNLPLARIKKIMKTEEFILQELEKDRMKADAVENTAEDTSKSNIKFMIAGEAPVVVSRACELLIRELTCRAWQHTERNRRRTLQRQDIHAAVGESDVYDFLIDIVPRVTSSTSRSAQAASDVGMPHQHLAHGIPQPMDSAASLMGQTLGTDFMADPQQQFNYLMHMQQQQQQQHAGVVDQNDPSNLGVPQQPNQGWHDGGV